MRPWERRLKDVAQLLRNCEATYFDPELYRMNTNQFLQTARTVTFIIQKNKDAIPDFEAWYTKNVTSPWRSDIVMTWAKDSRNAVEKQGDLELNSTLELRLIFSYIEEQDIRIPCGRVELLGANLMKLVAFAKKNMPSSVLHNGVVKIERRWVANSLPAWELLHALTYIYGRIFDACERLASHIGTKLDESIPHVSRFDQTVTDARYVRYLKLNAPALASLTSKSVSFDPDFEPWPLLRQFAEEKKSQARPTSLEKNVQYHARMAKITFEQFGNHVPMLFLFDEDWRPVDFLSTEFADQAEKFIFWRSVADRIELRRAYSLIWICEAWIRDTRNPDVPTHEMPIKGERLHVEGMDRNGYCKSVSWEIKRDGEGKATLEQVETAPETELTWNYLIPARTAFARLSHQLR